MWNLIDFIYLYERMFYIMDKKQRMTQCLSLILQKHCLYCFLRENLYSYEQLNW